MTRRTIGTIQVALATLVWSVSGVFTKYLPWGGMSLFGIRAIFASIALLIIRRGRKIHFSKGVWLGTAGTTLTSLLFINSTKLTSAANAITLQYAMPVFVIAFCWIAFHRKPTTVQVVSSLCILCGVALCSVEGIVEGLGGGVTAGKTLGDILAIASAVTFALVFFSSDMPDTNSQDYIFLGMLCSTPFSLFAFFDENMTVNPTHWLIVVIMGICLALGYYFIAVGMKNTSPVTAALLSNLEPVLNPLWVFLFLGDAPSALTLVGAAVVIISATAYSIISAKAAPDKT